MTIIASPEKGKDSCGEPVHIEPNSTIVAFPIPEHVKKALEEIWKKGEKRRKKKKRG